MGDADPFAGLEMQYTKTTLPVQMLFFSELTEWSPDGLRKPHKKRKKTVISNCHRMITTRTETVWLTL